MPCAVTSSGIPLTWGKGQGHWALSQKLMEVLERIRGLPLVFPAIQWALADNVVPCLKRGVITQAIDLAWDVKALAILP